MLAIRKVETIDLDEDEIRRKEEALARLIFTAAQRKLKNRQPTPTTFDEKSLKEQR
jgi:hypothetical protein